MSAALLGVGTAIRRTLATSGAGVERAVDFLEVFPIDMRVDLRCGDIGVAEHLLHGA
jgi:hypothetical protein